VDLIISSHDVVIAVSTAKRGIYLFDLTLFIFKAMHHSFSTPDNLQARQKLTYNQDDNVEQLR